jgi:hypothetical protein
MNTRLLFAMMVGLWFTVSAYFLVEYVESRNAEQKIMEVCR